MKKLVSLLCTFILLLGVMVIPANAAAITVSLPKVEAAPGAQVKIPVTISNNPGVAGFLLEFSYSSDLKLTAATRNTRNDIGSALTLGGFAANPHPVKYRMLIAEIKNMHDNGKIATLTFTAPDKAGTYPIKVVWKDEPIAWDSNYDLYDLPCAVVNGSVTVKERNVSSVSLNQSTMTLNVGKQEQLQATCKPNNATNKTIRWSSQNTAIASVDNNGYVTGHTKGTTTITAKSHNGKTASCIVTVFGKNEIQYDNFRYNFLNSPDSFGYSENIWPIPSRRIPKERYMQLGYSEAKAKKKVEPWGGNCYGMSASSVLFYKGIMQEEKYDANVHFPHDFAAPNNWGLFKNENDPKVKLRYMIELLQVAQEWVSPLEKEFSKNDIINELNNGNPVGLRLRDQNGNHRHRVVIYDYITSGAVYIFKIYDCADYVDYLTCTTDDDVLLHYLKEKDKTEKNWVKFNYHTVAAWHGLYSALKQLNYNDAASLLSVEAAEPTYTYLFTPAMDITLTNASGQTAAITNGEVSGDIKDISVQSSAYLAPEQTYTIKLPTDSYTITGSGDEVITIAFADDYMSTDSTAKANTPITLSADLKQVDIGAAAGDTYSVLYSTYDNVFDEMTLSGTAADAVTTILNGAEVTLTGVETLAVSATVSEAAVSAEAENLTGHESVTITCEEAESGTTLQILGDGSELTEKEALPERLQAEAPVCSVEGGTYTEGQLLSFDKDDETVIYYTTDGTTPSADNGTIYSLPIEINKTMTVKAIATKYGYTDSEVVTLSYTLPTVDMPYAMQAAGTYNSPITVTLMSDSYDDSIYYTTDGSDPLENGQLYTVPLHIEKTTKVRAYAVQNGCNSNVCSYQYTIKSTKPFYFSNALKNQDNAVLTPETLADLTKVKLTAGRLQDGEHTGRFLLAFYDKDGKLLYMTSKTDVVNEDAKEIEFSISEDVSKAYSVKAFAWNNSEDMKPICAAYKEQLVEVPVDEPVEDESTQDTEQTEENGQSTEETQG